MKIERGIEIPSRRENENVGSDPSEVHLFLVGMEVLDSVVFDDGNATVSKNYALARKVAQRKGLKFCSRSISKSSCRVWRIA